MNYFLFDFSNNMTTNRITLILSYEPYFIKRHFVKYNILQLHSRNVCILSKIRNIIRFVLKDVHRVKSKAIQQNRI